MTNHHHDDEHRHQRHDMRGSTQSAAGAGEGSAALACSGSRSPPYLSQKDRKVYSFLVVTTLMPLGMSSAVLPLVTLSTWLYGILI